MARFVIGLIIGLILGGAATFYFFIGVPRAANSPGTPIRRPDTSVQPAGTAQVVLGQDFFNGVLEIIFRDMQPPVFPLGPSDVEQNGQPCASQITILREGSGTQTAVRFENNTISAPLAFSGNYNSVFGCLQFTGWAQTNLELRYDSSRQSVFGQLNVETVNLDGVNPLISGFVTPLVQTTLNTRVNPILILDGRQIAVRVPVAAANGNLHASVSDVRAEVRDNALNLHVIYDFSGQQAQPQQQPALP